MKGVHVVFNIQTTLVSWQTLMEFDCNSVFLKHLQKSGNILELCGNMFHLMLYLKCVYLLVKALSSPRPLHFWFVCWFSLLWYSGTSNSARGETCMHVCPCVCVYSYYY